MVSKFEKGMRYEKLRANSFFHKFLGWACIVLSPILSLFSLGILKIRFVCDLFLFIFGLLSLYLGYSEAKEMREMENLQINQKRT